MNTPRAFAAGLGVCLGFVLTSTPLADARLLGGSSGPTTTTDEAAPWGQLTAGSDLVRAGTRVALTWEINLPDDISHAVDLPPDGTIIPRRELLMKVRVLGVAFQSGNTLLPIQAHASVNGAPWSPFFYDIGPNVDPTELLIEQVVQRGDRIRFGARGYNRGWYPFHQTGNSDPYVTVLKNGDKAPYYKPAYDQGDIESFLSPYLTKSGEVRIGPRDLIVLWECSTASPGSTYFDMQDLVVLLTFEERSLPPAEQP